MPEQLSQEQIDALLGRLTSGEAETETAAEKEEKNIRKYDFYSPKKFTKEQLRAMDGLHENFSRMLSSYLSGALQVVCEATVLSIEEQRYFEYNNALPDNALIGLVGFRPENKHYSEGMLIMDLSTSLGFFMIDRLLGGGGDEYNLNRDYTDIEIAILQFTFEKILDRLQNAWCNYVQLELPLTSIETNARLMQALAPDDIVVIVTLNIKVKDLTGFLNICIPAENLEEVIGNFSAKYVRSSKRKSLEDDETRRQRIFNDLLNTDLEIKAVLDQSQLTLQDVLQLQVDDVIPLTRSINSDILVTIDDIPWYSAKLGEVKTKKAIKINESFNAEN